MTDTRTDQRVSYTSNCLLDIQNTSYSGLLENISFSGASVEIIGDVPENSHCGEECVLTVLLIGAVKYPCRILRIDSSKIALKFLDS